MLSTIATAMWSMLENVLKAFVCENCLPENDTILDEFFVRSCNYPDSGVLHRAKLTTETSTFRCLLETKLITGRIRKNHYLNRVYGSVQINKNSPNQKHC